MMKFGSLNVIRHPESLTEKGVSDLIRL